MTSERRKYSQEVKAKASKQALAHGPGGAQGDEAS